MNKNNFSPTEILMKLHNTKNKDTEYRVPTNE